MPRTEPACWTRRTLPPPIWANADKGSGAGEVMIHELVHQWWGLGNMFDTSEPASPWSAEGLTVYTTYRIVKELYGEDYAQENYVDQWQQAVDDYYLNFYVRNPEVSGRCCRRRSGWKSPDSLPHVRQYCEMPLKILKAEQLVGGEEAMDQILHDLFNRELDPMYPYLTYQEFLERLRADGGGLEPCVKFFDMNAAAAVESIFCGPGVGAAVLRLAGAGRRDHPGRVPHGPLLPLELWGLSEPDAAACCGLGCCFF